VLAQPVWNMARTGQRRSCLVVSRAARQLMPSHLCYTRGSLLWTKVTLLGSCWSISPRPSTESIIIYNFRNYWITMSLNAFCDGFFLICLSDSREPVLKEKYQTGSTSMVPCPRALCWGHWPFWFKLMTWLQGASHISRWTTQP